jgi:hypothetical protein
MDIKLTTEGILFENGKIKLTQSVGEKVSQRLYIRFRTHLGSWWLNQDYGVNYFDDLLGKNKSKTGIDSIIRSIIREDAYVESIKSFTSKVVGRNYSCSFAVSVYGDTTEYTTVSLLLTESGLSLTDQLGNQIIF